tara:strand:+ start:355 stop:936 length:582 start_codon:yes stop_codon:yes gene_type:complete
MKTIKRKVLVVVFMLMTLVNYANKTALNNVLNAKKIMVVFKDVKKGQQLTIKDDSGIVLHLENVEKGRNLIKLFDFSKLKDGNYTLELEKDFEIIIKSITVKGNIVVFDDDAQTKIFKPVIRNEKNRVMITQIAFDKKPIEIAIYYNGEVIYSETLKGSPILNRVYRLDGELIGDYKVIVNNNGRSYVNNFKL